MLMAGDTIVPWHCPLLDALPFWCWRAARSGLARPRWQLGVEHRVLQRRGHPFLSAEHPGWRQGGLRLCCTEPGGHDVSSSHGLAQDTVSDLPTDPVLVFGGQPAKFTVTLRNGSDGTYRDISPLVSIGHCSCRNTGAALALLERLRNWTRPGELLARLRRGRHRHGPSLRAGATATVHTGPWGHGLVHVQARHLPIAGPATRGTRGQDLHRRHDRDGALPKRDR